MRAKHRVWTILGVGLLLSCAAVPVWADRGIKQDPGYYKERGYVLDKRYQHNHYYPPHGHVIDALPHNHHVVTHHGAHYYYHGGVWYRPYGPRFIVGLPPFGVVVPILPPYYTTLWVGGIP